MGSLNLSWMLWAVSFSSPYYSSQFGFSNYNWIELIPFKAKELNLKFL